MNSFLRFTSSLLLITIATLTALADQSGIRSVHGTVLDTQEHPLSSAVVYLHNQRTHTVHTYYSDNRGNYHFSGLRPYDDYTIHAEHGHMTSKVHAISASNQKRELLLDLKVDKQRELTNKALAPSAKTELLSGHPTNQLTQSLVCPLPDRFRDWPFHTEHFGLRLCLGF